MSALDKLMGKKISELSELQLSVCYYFLGDRFNDVVKKRATAAAEQLSALHARIEEGDKALDLCVMFLTNTNTINEDKQAELVKHLREVGRVDLADAIALGGFASVLFLGDE